ncbi:MAG: hypothetical protein IJ184_03105 [Alphaproteobacteria bacterium]|nr:hypothetical protein [Alphaproteobacteria bacterium]
MLWIINGLIYGFFTALYTIVNQKHKFNGYVLGVWRGFGIAAIFAGAWLMVPPPEGWRSWGLLIIQGLLIGVYDSHIFFAAAKFGANTTARILVLSVIFTLIIWWGLTPQKFGQLVQNAEVFVTLLLCLGGFCVCYWYMMRAKITRRAFWYMLPATLALAGMSAATKEIAVMRDGVWVNIVYYMSVSTFISGVYNLIWLIKTENITKIGALIFNRQVMKTGVYIVGFSLALIAAKTIALRLAPNPAYVVTLLLSAPVFVYLLGGKYEKSDTSFKAGASMLFFLVLLMLLTAGSYGVAD